MRSAWTAEMRYLPDELAGPGHQLRDGLAVAQAEHLEHAGIGLGRAQEPVLHVGLDSVTDWPLELKPRSGHGVEDEAGGWFEMRARVRWAAKASSRGRVPTGFFARSSLMEPVDGAKNGCRVQARPQSRQAPPPFPQRVYEPFVGRRIQLLVNASKFHRPNP